MPETPVPEDLGGFSEEPRLRATIMAELATLAQRVQALEVALAALHARLDTDAVPRREGCPWRGDRPPSPGCGTRP
jgi:hypothetical protein